MVFDLGSFHIGRTVRENDSVECFSSIKKKKNNVRATHCPDSVVSWSSTSPTYEAGDWRGSLKSEQLKQIFISHTLAITKQYPEK